MNAGISSIGLYVPRFRLSGKVLTDAWHRPMGKGSKSVPNFDEDSLTMAVNAVINTLPDGKTGSIEGSSEQPEALYFATTTSPYNEKSSAALIATAVDLKVNARTMDFSGSLRSGTSALIAGIESIQAGSLKSLIAASADTRFAEPGSDLEPVIGAGAAAVILTSDKTRQALEITGYSSTAANLTDYWRRKEDRYIHHSDLKYAMTYGATKTVIQAVSEFADSTGRNISEYGKVVLGVPDGRSTRTIAKQLKLNPDQIQDSFIQQIGLTGSSHAFIMLAGAYEHAPEGSEILIVNYGDGCDIISLKKRGSPSKPGNITGITDHLTASVELPSYTKYLSYHNLINESNQNLTTEPFSSTILSKREEGQNIRLHGRMCNNCGTINNLELNVCPHCKTRNDFRDHKLSKTGIINTFTQEYYYPTPEPPVTMAVIDLDGGGRILAQMTDSDPKSIEIDMPVELTFRRLHQGGEFFNYCWKCRPVISAGKSKTGGEGE